jgi:hypothetical protein
MKCWKSASNTRGSRPIVLLQVGAMKIYAATVETLKRKERQGETQFTIKTEVNPPLNTKFFFWVGFYFF